MEPANKSRKFQHEYHCTALLCTFPGALHLWTPRITRNAPIPPTPSTAHYLFHLYSSSSTSSILPLHVRTHHSQFESDDTHTRYTRLSSTMSILVISLVLHINQQSQHFCHNGDFTLDIDRTIFLSIQPRTKITGVLYCKYTAWKSRWRARSVWHVSEKSKHYLYSNILKLPQQANNWRQYLLHITPLTQPHYPFRQAPLHCLCTSNLMSIPAITLQL